jgi:hypothetical protein
MRKLGYCKPARAQAQKKKVRQTEVAGRFD